MHSTAVLEARDHWNCLVLLGSVFIRPTLYPGKVVKDIKMASNILLLILRSLGSPLLQWLRVSLSSVRPLPHPANLQSEESKPFAYSWVSKLARGAWGSVKPQVDCLWTPVPWRICDICAVLGREDNRFLSSGTMNSP